MNKYDYSFWKPMLPEEARSLFAAFATPWWISGGWAIDLYLGRQTRDHGDLDIGVLRRDQLLVQQHLAGWELHCSDPPGQLRPWRPGEWLAAAVHDIWSRRDPNSPWEFQVMLNESDGEDWVSRRDPRIRLPLSEALLLSGDGIPFLAPWLQLHFKAGSPRDRDEADFEATIGALPPERRRWLDDAIELSYGDHPWSIRLR